MNKHCDFFQGQYLPLPGSKVRHCKVNDSGDKYLYPFIIVYTRVGFWRGLGKGRFYDGKNGAHFITRNFKSAPAVARKSGRDGRIRKSSFYIIFG
jgi:hypothetical protein